MQRLLVILNSAKGLVIFDEFHERAWQQISLGHDTDVKRAYADCVCCDAATINSAEVAMVSDTALD